MEHFCVSLSSFKISYPSNDLQQKKFKFGSFETYSKCIHKFTEWEAVFLRRFWDLLSTFTP